MYGDSTRNGEIKFSLRTFLLLIVNRIKIIKISRCFFGPFLGWVVLLSSQNTEHIFAGRRLVWNENVVL